MISDDDFHTLLNAARQMLEAGKELETIIRILRQNGCTQVDCIRIVMDLNDSTLEEANSLVHYSKAWEDMRERTEKVHNAFIDCLEELQNDSGL